MPDIKGYRNLEDEELALVNQIKVTEEDLGQSFRTIVENAQHVNADPRWIAIAKTHFQEGFMALVRSVTRPDDWY